MRLFIAAALPEELLEALAETSAALRASVHGRFVAADAFHVTLAFLGDVDVSRIVQVEEALERGCSGFTSFEVALGELGSFGRRSKATLWQGFEKAGELPELAKSVRAELSGCDLPFDDKKFLAHVTLMRNADLTVGALPCPVMSTGSISEIVLYSSDLSGERPHYERLHTCRLSRRSSVW